MFIGLNIPQPRRIFSLLVVCSICLSLSALAAGKGKKGKPEPAGKQSSRTGTGAGKAAPKKAATKTDARNQKTARLRDNDRTTQLAKTSAKSAPGAGRGKKQDAGKRGAKGDKRLAEAKSKSPSRKQGARAQNSKGGNSRVEKQAPARLKATEEKNDKARRSAAKESAREEKVVQSKPAAIQEKAALSPAGTPPERKGKFGRSASRDEAELEIIQNKPAFDGKTGSQAAASLSQTMSAEANKVGREAAPSVVPDRVEVIEYDPNKAGVDSTSSSARPLRALAATDSFHVSRRRIDVRIDERRVFQIQAALNQKGFYAGEPTGVWDDLTYDAMKRFQMSQKIDATGYPTAHALKRLGLTTW